MKPRNIKSATYSHKHIETNLEQAHTQTPLRRYSAYRPEETIPQLKLTTHGRIFLQSDFLVRL